jgi:hypothetical protein
LRCFAQSTRSSGISRFVFVFPRGCSWFGTPLPVCAFLSHTHTALPRGSPSVSCGHRAIRRPCQQNHGCHGCRLPTRPEVLGGNNSHLHHKPNRAHSHHTRHQTMRTLGHNMAKHTEQGLIPLTVDQYHVGRPGQELRRSSFCIHALTCAPSLPFHPPILCVTLTGMFLCRSLTIAGLGSRCCHPARCECDTCNKG